VVPALLEGVVAVADVEGPGEPVAARPGHEVDDAAGREAVLGLEAAGEELDLVDGVEVEVDRGGGHRRIGRVHAVDEVGVLADRRPDLRLRNRPHPVLTPAAWLTQDR
jgi:hypothetical protein